VESSPRSEPAAAPAATTAIAPPSSSSSAGVPFSRALIPLGNFFFKYRDFLSPAVFVLLVLIFRPPPSDRRVNWVTNAIGIALIVAGAILRSAVIGYAYIKRGGKDKQVYAEQLVVEGFFAHARNPLYVGNYLTILGLFVILNNPWAYLVGVGFYTLLYLAIVSAEENFLLNKFGQQYLDYCSRVNRFMLRFAGMSESLKDMSWDWRRVVRKEYGTTFTWVVCVLGLLAWEHYLYFGYTTRDSVYWILGILFGVACVLWLAARIAKKSEKLGSG
jgi:protein-S-isoprenylcysteine O-methyltransferase Ste14